MFENRWYSVPKHFHTTSCNVIFLLHPPNIYLSSLIYIPMGQLSNGDLVLLMVQEYPNMMIAHEDWADISGYIGITPRTMKRFISEQYNKGYLYQKWIRGVSYSVLTVPGKKRIREIQTELEGFYLTPLEHSVPSPIKLVTILKLINNPFFRVFLINLFLKRNDFDIIDTLKTFEILENDTSVYNLFENVDLFKGHISHSNFVHSFMEHTLYGLESEKKGSVENDKDRSYQVFLVDADLRVARGRFQEALDLYNSIIENKGLPQDIWFLACIGKIRTLGKMGNMNEMEKTLEKTRSKITNKMVNAYLLQLEADFLGIDGRVERSKQLFESCIGTFRHYNNPLFLSIAYNNFGILMFNEENYSEAERLWKQARKFARNAKSEYQEAIVLTNLASIMRRRGNINKSIQYLENAKKIYSMSKNLEKLADVEFNFALVYLQEKQFDIAMDFFNRSMLDTFPFLSENMRTERLSVLSREAEKIKYTPQKNGTNYKLVYIE